MRACMLLGLCGSARWGCWARAWCLGAMPARSTRPRQGVNACMRVAWVGVNACVHACECVLAISLDGCGSARWGCWARAWCLGAMTARSTRPRRGVNACVSLGLHMNACMHAAWAVWQRTLGLLGTGMVLGGDASALHTPTARREYMHACSLGGCECMRACM